MLFLLCLILSLYKDSKGPSFFSSSPEAEAVNNNFLNVHYLIKEIEACNSAGVKRQGGLKDECS